VRKHTSGFLKLFASDLSYQKIDWDCEHNSKNASTQIRKKTRDKERVRGREKN
jgi:hypothetical protein